MSSTRILIIEDEESLFEIYEEWLKELGVKVTSCSDGYYGKTEFLKSLLREDEYRLIILDWKLPHVEGLNILKMIRRNDTAQRKTPVLVASGYLTQEDIDKIMELGGSTILNKPFDQKEFVNKVKAILEQETPSE